MEANASIIFQHNLPGPGSAPQGDLIVSNIDQGSSLDEAERQATTINAYWAERGQCAGARAVPVYDHRGRFLSYGVTSDLIVFPRNRIEDKR